jgi:hypothetical protein
MLTVLGNVATIALEVFLNMDPRGSLPNQLQLAVQGIWSFLTNWAILLLFLLIMAVLRNRETVICTKADWNG